MQPNPHHSRQCACRGWQKPAIYMSMQLNDAVWVTLMHELETFVRYHMEKPETMTEVRHLMEPPVEGRFAPAARVAAAQIVRAFELLAPALMVDFLAENSAILNPGAFANWAAERQELQEAVSDLLA
jgi:hypothetical protein